MFGGNRQTSGGPAQLVTRVNQYNVSLAAWIRQRYTLAPQLYYSRLVPNVAAPIHPTLPTIASTFTFVGAYASPGVLTAAATFTFVGVQSNDGTTAPTIYGSMFISPPRVKSFTSPTRSNVDTLSSTIRVADFTSQARVKSFTSPKRKDNSKTHSLSTAVSN
jgi:hypothetical protein